MRSHCPAIFTEISAAWDTEFDVKELPSAALSLHF